MWTFAFRSKGKGFTVGHIKGQTQKPFLTPPNLLSLLEEPKRRTSKKDSQKEDIAEHSVIDQVLSVVPCGDLDDEVVSKIHEISKVMEQNNMPNDEPETLAQDSASLQATAAPTEPVFGGDEELMETFYETLQSEPKTRVLWATKTVDELRLILASSIAINNQFTKASILAMLKTVPGIGVSTSLSKRDLVNKMSVLVGNRTQLDTKTSKPRSPKSLKQYASTTVGKFSKLALNSIVATNTFQQKVEEWKMRSFFKDRTVIGEDYMHSWYSQPEYVPEIDDYVLAFMDCHHLFVNARGLVCSKGIPSLGVSKEAWRQVALGEKENKTGLSIAMVEDMIDKQSNAFARRTFSESVEAEMRKLSFNVEADFCRDLRNWYEAEDQPGLSAEQRFQDRMIMRQRLLSAVNLGVFPPPGKDVGGMPIAMFEGILTNIDRRLQLHVLARGGVFNVRALGSLEVETFFSCFQAWDPRSTGILRADDVPKVIETASFLHRTKTDSTRTFSMRTSRESVYPLHRGEPMEGTESQGSSVSSTSQRILLRDHDFDQPLRRKDNPKRKWDQISRLDKPARGTSGVRQHHRVDESKILPHKREGIIIKDW